MALTLSTVAVTKATPLVVPDVRTAVTTPAAFVVPAGSPDMVPIVPRVVVKVTVEPTVGVFWLENTSTRMVAVLVPLFLIPAPPNIP